MQEVAALKPHRHEVLSLHYSGPSTHLLASAGRDRRLQVFDLSLSGSKIITPLHCLSEQSSSITRVRFARFVLAVRVCKFEWRAHLCCSKITTMRVLCMITASHDGSPIFRDGKTLVSCSADRSIVFHGITPERKLEQTHKAVLKKGTPCDLAVHPNDKFLVTAAQHDRFLRIWGLSSGRQARTYRIGGEYIPEGSTSTSVSSSISVFSSINSSIDDSSPGPEPLKVALDPSGTVCACAASDKTLRLFDWLSGDCIDIMYGQAESITGTLI